MKRKAVHDPKATTQPIIGQRRVFIRNLACLARIGVHDWEKERPQLILVDIDAYLDDLPHHDRLDQTICFDQLAQTTRNIIATTSCELLESLIEHIANGCFSATKARKLRIIIHKPDAIAGADDAGVEISRERDKPRERDKT